MEKLGDFNVNLIKKEKSQNFKLKKYLSLLISFFYIPTNNSQAGC
jgi:hypothetical protein